MAVIKYGAIVTSGSGSLGGSTLQAGHSAPIWRNKPQQTFSRTQAQSIIRGYNKKMQAGWRSLSYQDKQIWNDFAISKPVLNRSGEKHPLSGHSLWMKYQFTYLSNNVPFLITPSHYKDPPLGPELVLNGGFVNASDWIVGISWSISAGKAHYDASGVNTIRQNVSLPIHEYLRLSFDISNCAGLAYLFFASLPGDLAIFPAPFNNYVKLSNGNYKYFMKSVPDSTYAWRLYGSTVGQTYSIDNISMKRVYL